MSILKEDSLRFVLGDIPGFGLNDIKGNLFKPNDGKVIGKGFLCFFLDYIVPFIVFSLFLFFFCHSLLLVFSLSYFATHCVLFSFYFPYLCTLYTSFFSFSFFFILGFQISPS